MELITAVICGMLYIAFRMSTLNDGTKYLSLLSELSRLSDYK